MVVAALPCLGAPVVSDINRPLFDAARGHLRDCRQITREEVEGWSIGRRLWNNALAVVGPVL
ncbi:MAG: hypothetical protein AB7L41_09970 [Flavobacteriaceae bacterium]